MQELNLDTILQSINDYKMAEAFDMLDKAGAHGHLYNQLKQEYMYGKINFDFVDRLKVFVTDFLKNLMTKPKASEKKKVLFVSSSPSRLRELYKSHQIYLEETKIDESKYECLPPATEYTPIDVELIRAFKEKVQIIHFSEHGDIFKELTLKEVTALFRNLKEGCECLLLDCSNSAYYAPVLSEEGFLVIELDGNGIVSNNFENMFYRALSHGADYLTCAKLSVIGASDHVWPHKISIWKSGRQIEI